MLPPNRMKRKKDEDELEKYEIPIVILTEFETMDISKWRQQHEYKMERLIRVT